MIDAFIILLAIGLGLTGLAIVGCLIEIVVNYFNKVLKLF